MRQNAADHSAAKLDPRKRSHPRTQRPIGVVNRQFDSISGLVLLIGFAFTADLRDDAVKGAVGEGPRSEPRPRN